MTDKWMQHASEEMERKGTKGSYGHHSMKQINKDIHKGGKRGKKAAFAKMAKKVAAKRRRKGGHK